MSLKQLRRMFRYRIRNLFAFRLIKAGTSLEHRNARQWTPLDCAAAHGWEKVVLALLEAGANVQPKNTVL